VATNTACSSSLVAAHLAATALRNNECAFAAAAGANAVLLPLGATAAMTQVHALAPDGRCKSYGAEADGYGRGEGFLVAILEGLQSVAEPLLVQAILAGSAVNQDGRSSGLTAPHGPSQAALVTATMQQAGISHLAYVATHGTGTPLVRGNSKQHAKLDNMLLMIISLSSCCAELQICPHDFFAFACNNRCL
jgi:acyl transferase domain-containing protein